MSLSFSIITVCFNNAETIRDTLQTIASQTWSSWEHIIVDGASRDDTTRIVAPFISEKTTFISEPDKGIYDAMNKGIARAKGDIICFLNADDFYASADILEAVAQMMSDFELDAVLGDVEFFNADNPNKTVRRYNSGQFSPSRLAFGWMPAHPGMFVRRGIYERVGNFRTDYQIAADYEWIVRAFHGTHIKYKHLPKVLVRMRTGGASTKGLRSTFVLNKEILRACRENGISTSIFKLMTKVPRKLLELVVK